MIVKNAAYITHLFSSSNSQYLGEGNGNPLQYSCLENLMDGGAWWAAVHEVAKSWTWLSNFTFTFHFHALEKEMATHSSVLAWRIPGTGEPGGLPSMGLHRVGHDWSDLAAAEAAGKASKVCQGISLWYNPSVSLVLFPFFSSFLCFSPLPIFGCYQFLFSKLPFLL